MSYTQERVLKSLTRLLDRRRDREADVRASRVVGRNTDGTAQLQRLDGDCVARGGGGGRTGEIVTELPSIINSRGTSGVALRALSGTARTQWIERIDPEMLSAGVTQDVDVYGGGFTPATEFEFLSPGSDELNPDITVEASDFVDAGHVTLSVTVAPDAELFDDTTGLAGIAFGDPS